MYSRTIIPVRLILITVLSLSLTACPSWWPWRTDKPSEAVVSARQSIAQNRQAVLLLVPRIKQKFKGKESATDYKRARTLYDTAMIENNAWVTSLKLGIENDENLEKSQAFKDKAQAAVDATETFVKFGRKLTDGRMPADISIAVSAGVIASTLVENGIVIWKAYRAEQTAERLSQAERTKKELEWLSWETIK